ncbi:MAG: DUF2178 domain-containing protein [Dehalococcoidales bacterium]|jgi:uncharacterized membrane protein
MNFNTYRNWRMTLLVIGTILAAVSVAIGNAYILIGAVAAGMIILFILRRRVKEVTTDERNYAVASKAARLTVSLVGLGMAVTGAILLAFHRADLSAGMAQVGLALLYATCGLLLINLSAYTYYNRKMGGKE